MPEGTPDRTPGPTAVPMVDLRAQYATLKPGIDAAIAAVLGSTHFILGEEVRAFEREAAAYLGSRHAIGCANGTDALQLALRALDLGPGDEVITTPFTFIATAEAIASVGATPTFVDIDPATGLMDVARVEAAITPRTRAILPVHLFGLPCDLPALVALAERHGLRMVEDCAQSFGAAVGERMTGTFGDVGCFSFFPSKNLGAFGDGGMLVTDDDALATRLRSLRAHGRGPAGHSAGDPRPGEGDAGRYLHVELGCNSRLDELQAAILRCKLPHLPGFNEARRRVASRYREALAGVALELPPMEMRYAERQAASVFHQFTIRCERRDAVRAALAAENVASAIYYPVPLHRQPAIRNAARSGTGAEAEAAMPDFPEADRLAAQCLSLPIHPELEEATVERVAAIVRRALAGSPA